MGVEQNAHFLFFNTGAFLVPFFDTMHGFSAFPGSAHNFSHSCQSGVQKTFGGVQKQDGNIADSDSKILSFSKL